MLTPNEISKNTIGLDDEFRFKCRACGKCCKNRDDILLNPRDLYNIARKLNQPIAQVALTYCEAYTGATSRLPIVRLKPLGPERVCPLLTGNRCSVHDAKPTVCALFPLGRVKMNPNGEPLTPSEPATTGYILQPISCGGTNQNQTVRKWLDRFGIPIDDTFFDLWNGAIVRLSILMRNTEKRVSPEAFRMFTQYLTQSLYFNYDLALAFLPQFIANSANLEPVLEKLETWLPPKPDYTP